MTKVSIIPNITKDPSFKSTEKMVRILQSLSITPQLCDKYKDSGLDASYMPEEELSEADMIIVLGGDGTLLGTVRKYHKSDVPILGINHGNFGFLTEVERDDSDLLIDILKGNFVIEERMMLKVTIDHNESETYFALNDVTTHRGDSLRMHSYCVYVDDILVTSFHADGVVVSTPTGSTGYSLSAGGPIVDPTVEVLVITPICTHNLYTRSIVVPNDKHIKIAIKETGNDNAFIILDGQVRYQIEAGQELNITGSKKIKLVRSYDNTFYTKLRKKMFERG